MEDFKLSEHFKFFELTKTSSHPEVQEQNRANAMACIKEMADLCAHILEKMRTVFGPLTVNTGFRNKTDNDDVHGSPTSQHMTGEAADINCATDTDEKRVEMAKWLKASGIPFGQCLIEAGCLHVSLPGKHLNQVGRAERKDGKWTITELV